MPVKLLIISILLVSGLAIAQDMETGPIIEVSANGEYVQLYDKVFRVNKVVVDDGRGRFVDAARTLLKEGDLVTVILHHAKGSEFSVAEKLILYRSDKKKEIYREMELDKEKTGGMGKVMPFTPRRMIMKKDGVWRN